MIAKLNIKHWVLNILYPYYNRITMFLVICFFIYEFLMSSLPNDIQNIAWVLEALTPDFWEQFEGTNPLAPIDFVN